MVRGAAQRYFDTGDEIFVREPDRQKRLSLKRALAARGGPGARATGAAGRGGAAARGRRGQEVMSVDDTSSDSDPAELSSPRKQRRRVETGAAARGASGHGPGHAAAVAEQQAPAAANAQGDAVANNPPAPPPTQPPGPPAAPAPAFDPLHPSRAAVVGAVSHYLGIVYNSDAVENDATGQVATLSLAFIERLIHAAPPPPPPRCAAPARAPVFDPLHPGAAPAIRAWSQLAGTMLNSAAVQNDRTGQAGALALSLFERILLQQAPPQ